MKVRMLGVRLLGALAVASALVAVGPTVAAAADASSSSSSVGSPPTAAPVRRVADEAERARAEAGAARRVAAAEAAREAAEEEAARAAAEAAAAQRAAARDERPGQVVEVPFGGAATGAGSDGGSAPWFALGALQLVGAAAVAAARVRARTP